MTRKEFIKMYVMPFVKKNDKPFNRQLFNDTLDNAHRNGWITDKQAQNWIYPQTRLFE